jgi:hypothetical protein
MRRFIFARQTSSGLHVRGSLVEPHSAAPCDVLTCVAVQEIELDTELAIKMHGQSTVLYAPDKSGSGRRGRSDADQRQFTFDHSFWSHDPDDVDNFHTQQYVYESIGRGVLENALNGFNACIFAYGQVRYCMTVSTITCVCVCVCVCECVCM